MLASIELMYVINVKIDKLLTRYFENPGNIFREMCCGLPGHDVPDHGGRAGQVVVAEVEGAQGGHVGEGGGGDEGQLVGGHVEAGELRQVEAGQDGERGVGEVQHLHTELQT